ncbi:hypothetical protein [Flavobacterium mesophilum]|uniref:hypothetical protein n=1 Tax=Flavobacterium mesophilum TaxID=3143495 RepID=UPI0031CED274
MKKVKYVIIIFFSILLLLFIFARLTKAETTMIGGEEISLENPWRKTTEDENYKFDHLTDECDELYIKDVGNGEFILACLKKNKSWDFYWAMPKMNELLPLADEIKEDITPPK